MIGNIFDGITSYFKAFRIISSMRLWKYLFIPGLISLLLAGGIGTIAWGLSSTFGSFLTSWWPWEIGASIITSISGWLGGLLIFILGMIIYKHLVIVFVSPFMSPLSQKVESHLTGIDTPYSGFELTRAIKEISRGLLIAIRNIIREIFYVLLLFPLNLIPGIGNIIATGGIFLVQAFYAGFGNMDYTLERHFTRKESIAFVRKNRGLAIGNGTVFLLLLMTGIGFLFAPPLSTVAATLESVKRMNVDNIQPTTPENYV